MSEQVMEIIARLRLVPVVVFKDEKDALPLARALMDGGLPVAEITFRTGAAAGAIRAIRAAYPEMLVGAGTVTTTAQAETALEAGAQFLVSPGLSPAVTEFALAKGLPILPGITTATELMAAMEYGLSDVKFFPASLCGGNAALKALSSVFPHVRYMPTGGVGPSNLAEYLKNPRVLACGGSWMVKSELISAGRFDEITRLTAEAMRLVRETAVE